MAVDDTVKVTFHGNKLLGIGTLGDDGTVTDAVLGTGLVSMDAMENQAEAEAQYADDEVWTMISGAPLLQGSATFMQLNDDLRTDFFGQQEVSATLGTIAATGYADTGSYPQRILQVVSEGIATSKTDGSVKRAAVITVYPNAQVTSTPTKETETDTDGISVINWTANIQATATSKYISKGKSQAMYEYQIVGDEEVAAALAAIKDGKFFLPSTTTPPAGDTTGSKA